MPFTVYWSWSSSRLKFAKAMDEETRRPVSVVWDIEEQQGVLVEGYGGWKDIVVVGEMLLVGGRSWGETVEAA